MGDARHYLERELYELVRSDDSIFNFLQQGSLDGIWYWDLEDRDHEWMSAAFWETFGYDPAARKHLAPAWQDMIDPDDLTVALDNFNKHVAEPSHLYDQIVRYRHRDGSTVWVRCRGMAIRDEEGTPRRMLGAHTDVTALKRAEAELARQTELAEALRERAETNYDELWDMSPDMFVSVDAATARVKLCNETSATRLGYTKEEIVGRPIFDLYHPDCMSQAELAFRRFISEGSVDNFELALRRKDGGKIPVLLSVRGVRDDDGRVTHSVSTWRDISDLKRVERLEALTERLQLANAELEQYASIVSHDLQEPLRMVASFTQLLEEKLGDHEDEEVLRYLRFASEGATRMQGMVVDLLGYARVGRNEVRERVDAAKLMQEIRIDLSVLIESAEADLVVEELPVVVYDPTQLRQTLSNLVSNALKFHVDTSARVDVSARRRGEGWQFSVQDNGIGIDEKHRARIFRMFQRLHSREKFAGSGVGLAICKKIVESHGGEIWLESTPGEGTTFHFTIPDRQLEAAP